MSIEPALNAALEIVDLPTEVPTRASFAPFGTLIEPGEDGAPFGPDDAVLDFGAGTPRFYIMALTHRGEVATQITRHRRVTQCLATAGTEPWLIALAPPLDTDDPQAVPDLAAIKGFAVQPGTAIKLHAGTWHAGPFFAAERMNFFNLELSDTNETDHQTFMFATLLGKGLRFLPPGADAAS